MEKLLVYVSEMSWDEKKVRVLEDMSMGKMLVVGWERGKVEPLGSTLGFEKKISCVYSMLALNSLYHSAKTCLIDADSGATAFQLGATLPISVQKERESLSLQ